MSRHAGDQPDLGILHIPKRSSFAHTDDNGKVIDVSRFVLGAEYGVCQLIKRGALVVAGVVQGDPRASVCISQLQKRREGVAPWQ